MYCEQSLVFLVAKFEAPTIIGTHVAFRTAKMMYVLYPMFCIAGGVMYTIRKFYRQ